MIAHSFRGLFGRFYITYALRLEVQAFKINGKPCLHKCCLGESKPQKKYVHMAEKRAVDTWPMSYVRPRQTYSGNQRKKKLSHSQNDLAANR